MRLAAELIKRTTPDARVWVGTPSWVNHLPILTATGLQVETYTYVDPRRQAVEFDALIDALTQANAGDVVLLQAGCHNPTGCDLTESQWRELSDLCARNRLLPLIDCAYLGLGRGLGQDRAGIEIVCQRVPEALVAVSCSKNFGLYRERTGALFILAETAKHADASLSHLFAISRPNYSMPPDHGAAVVSTILTDAALTNIWDEELTEMRERILSVREKIASLLLSLIHISEPTRPY